jgi:hypothetical protein
MSKQSLIKEKFIDPAVASGDLGTLEKATAIWKTTVEAQKYERDIADSDSKKRSEKVRFWIPILVPLISSAALIATLIFQVIQFRENTRMMTNTAEDTSWREVLNRAKNTKGPEMVFSMTLIKGFLDSERYSVPAREISVTILARLTDADAFGILFPEIMNRTDWSNINDITRIGAGLNRAQRFLAKASDSISKRDIPDIMAGGMNDPKLLREGVINNLELTADAVINFLKLNGKNRENTDIIDLTDFQFAAKDLSNIDFSGSILRYTDYNKCTVKGALFNNIHDFEGSNWESTAWWRANGIDQRLLDYLEREFPYKVNVKYPNDTTNSLGDYSAAIDHLRSKKQK